MQRTYVIIITIVIIIVTMIVSKYYEYKDEYTEIKKNNVKYEEYLDREISGTDITTIINMAIDDNEKSFVEKDENNKYIQNDINSINIEIKIIDLEEDVIYTMETLYNGGMTNFVQYYSTILFKCTQIEYNSNGRVKYMLFEQITT